jgi:hypothetical protein
MVWPVHVYRFFPKKNVYRFIIVPGNYEQQLVSWKVLHQNIILSIFGFTDQRSYMSTSKI